MARDCWYILGVSCIVPSLGSKKLTTETQRALRYTEKSKSIDSSVASFADSLRTLRARFGRRGRQDARRTRKMLRDLFAKHKNH